MAPVTRIKEIMEAVTIPVMAKCRIGHFVEARIEEALGVDYVDESEVLTPADETHHIDKHAFTVPFVCGARNLGEALRRIAEGASMIRTKGEPGTGNIVEAHVGSTDMTQSVTRNVTSNAHSTTPGPLIARSMPFAFSSFRSSALRAFTPSQAM